MSADTKSATLHSAASTGNGTALEVTGYGVVGLGIVGSAGADRVVNFEASQDGTTYVAIQATNAATGTAALTATVTGTTAQLWRMAVGGFRLVRARLSGGTTGTVTITATALEGVM
jgi:hypothetical protein